MLAQSLSGSNWWRMYHDISSAVMAAERFYPSFQMVAWANKTPAEAMNVAIAEAYGRA